MCAWLAKHCSRIFLQMLFRSRSSCWWWNNRFIFYVSHRPTEEATTTWWRFQIVCTLELLWGSIQLDPPQHQNRATVCRGCRTAAAIESYPRHGTVILHLFKYFKSATSETSFGAIYTTIPLHSFVLFVLCCLDMKNWNGLHKEVSPRCSMDGAKYEWYTRATTIFCIHYKDTQTHTHTHYRTFNFVPVKSAEYTQKSIWDIWPKICGKTSSTIFFFCRRHNLFLWTSE